jgi:DNA polymerase III delta prime subunit
LSVAVAVPLSVAAYTNIEAVRTEIAEFATPPAGLPWLIDPRHRCVVLDEADHIPSKAQAALRGIMEEAAATGESNFTLTANEIGKIDAAIRSRCAVFDFSYSNSADREAITSAFRNRIATILDAEGLEQDQTLIDHILNRHGLDFRAALNEIQRRT